MIFPRRCKEGTRTRFASNLAARGGVGTILLALLVGCTEPSQAVTPASERPTSFATEALQWQLRQTEAERDAAVKVERDRSERAQRDAEALQKQLDSRNQELAVLRNALEGVTPAPAAPAPPVAPVVHAQAPSAAEAPPEATAAAVPAGPQEHTSSAERLRRLAIERAAIQPSRNYLIGPGDIVEINVFDLQELTKKLKVNSSGFIQLPLIGVVQAAGRSQEQLAADIAGKLGSDFLQDPQVEVVVEGYESAQVAVTGSVARPGLYPLTRERYTILDMISQAGGLTPNAGAMIQLIPAINGKASSAFAAANASALPVLGKVEGGETNTVISDSVAIDLNDLLRGGNRTALNVVVVPGDVIFVPEAGTFTIEGWIDKPGTYSLNRTTTVLAALSMGGGPLFPTRLSNVEILRNNEGSSAGRDAKIVDLKAIRDGTNPDVELRSGDIVHIPANPALVPLWAVYTLVKSLVTIGGSIPLF